MLRHQLAVALREWPRAAAGLAWPDRAWLALLAGTLPIDRLGRIRLIVTCGRENLRHLGRCSADRGWLGPAFGCRAGRSWSVRRWDDLRPVGLKLIFLIVSRAVPVLGLSRRGAVVEGRGDLDAPPSARCRPARAASRSFAFDVAGPGVAGAAGRDAARRPPRRDAADRHSLHDHAMAPRHRTPPVGACVAPWPLRPSAGAPQRAVCGAAACGGERVLGLPADPRRACRTGYHGRAVHGLADPQERRDRSGAPPGRPRAGPSSCGPRRRGYWRWTSSLPTCSTAPRSMSWPSSSTAPAASGSLAPPSIQSRPGSCSTHGTC